MAEKYDVAIVGARCAGAALATYLARAGAKVALLDALPRHSDTVVSTHTIHPAGVDVLKELGLGPQLAAGAPPWKAFRFDMEGSVFDIPMPSGREEHCPRRYFLDGLLQDAAESAGAEFLDRTRFESLLISDGRLSGVKCWHQGRPLEISAELVVGADGRNSLTARLVGAEEYLSYEAPRGCYWAYWETPHGWRTDAYPFQGYFSRRETLRFIFETNDNQLVIGTAPLVDVARAWRPDHVEHYVADLKSDPTVSAVLAGSRLASQVRGTLKERYFFRQAAGPGWALVGDAGHHSDYSIGDGMTQALQDARELASNLQNGISNDALAHFWRERDVRALPYFRLAEQIAAPDPPVELNRLIFARIGKSPQLIRRFWRQFEHEIDPLEAVPFSTVLGSVLDGVVRGQFGVVKQFARHALRIRQTRNEARNFRKRLRTGGGPPVRAK